MTGVVLERAGGTPGRPRSNREGHSILQPAIDELDGPELSALQVAPELELRHASTVAPPPPSRISRFSEMGVGEHPSAVHVGARACFPRGSRRHNGQAGERPTRSPRRDPPGANGNRANSTSTRPQNPHGEPERHLPGPVVIRSAARASRATGWLVPTWASQATAAASTSLAAVGGAIPTRTRVRAGGRAHLPPVRLRFRASRWPSASSPMRPSAARRRVRVRVVRGPDPPPEPLRAGVGGAWSLWRLPA